MLSWTPLIRRLVVRAAVLWALIRVVVVMLPALVAARMPSVEPSAAIAVIPLAIVLGLLEAWRRRERLLFANLALSPALHVACLAGVAIAGEAALAAMVMSLR